MQLTRRQVCAFGATTVLAGAVGMRITPVLAAENDFEEALKAFTGGAEVQTARVSLSAPEIAENGNTVPISVDVESPMTDEDYVAEVMVICDANPRAGIATFRFSPLCGEAAASTRVRLAQTQNVVAVAKMSDGSFFMDKKVVKVTIGGCGG